MLTYLKILQLIYTCLQASRKLSSFWCFYFYYEYLDKCQKLPVLFYGFCRDHLFLYIPLISPYDPPL